MANSTPITSLTLQAPAKVNIILRMLFKRDDGFHELETLMSGISLYDDIHLSTQTKGITLVSSRPFGPPEEDLAYRAAALFIEHTGIDGGVRIELTKTIPAGAGLGGGSSDAAAVLKGMAALYRHSFDASDEQLCEWAAELGSDIPFFVQGGTQWCTGRGERLQAAEPVVETLLIIAPGIPVPTPSVYGALTLTGEIRESNIAKQLLGSGGVGSHLVNDLEQPAFDAFPELAAIKRELRSHFAGLPVMMSGSGSAFFVVCQNKTDAQTLLITARESLDYPMHLVQTNASLRILNHNTEEGDVL